MYVRGDSSHRKSQSICSGKDADVIIWIVKYAREEHKATIEWLNNHTRAYT